MRNLDNNIPSASEQAKIDRERVNNPEKYSEVGSYVSRGFMEANDPNDCAVNNPCSFGKHSSDI